MSRLSDPAEPPAASLGERLHRAGRLMRYRLADELAAAGFDYPIDFWPTLKLLARREGVSQEEVAEFLVRDKATAARLLGRMDDAGLVTRRRDPADGRRKRVALTAHGRATHRRLAACAQRVQRAALRDIDPTQLEACTRVLEGVFDNLSPAEAAPRRPAATPAA